MPKNKKLPFHGGSAAVYPASNRQPPPKGNPYSRLEGPLRIGRKIVVTAPWQNYAPKGNEQVISLDPGRAFGTGSHPTTALCIEMLEDHLKKGDHPLDVGTGKGMDLPCRATEGFIFS